MGSGCDHYISDSYYASSSQFAAGWSAQALSLWAKSGDETGWLTLPQHLIDSAGVSLWLWDNWVSDHVRVQISEDLGLSVGETRIFVSWLAGTHDVGKASVPFAGMLTGSADNRHLGDRIVAAGLDLPSTVVKSDYYHHSVAGQAIIARWLKDRFGAKGRQATSIGAVAGAHHGLPAFAEQVRAASRHLEQPGYSQWKLVQDELLDNMTAFVGANEVLGRLIKGSPVSSTAQMTLTGITIMADWMASNSDAFPMRSSVTDDLGRLQRGVEGFALPGPWRPEIDLAQPADAAYRASFGWDEEQFPFPVQEALYEIIKENPKPEIICVEAPMGNGKTEGALQGATLLVNSLSLGGIMFAAPTMSTSNSLFERTADWAARVSGNDVVSLYLGHSKNILNEPFMKLSSAMIYDDGGLNDGLIIAHEWLWGRKKGILSDIVVGTIDQLLFMALQSKHVMLRHLGLVGKVVIVDEVHAYDAYMSSYLEITLEWLGAYRVPVILLSATLPHSIKVKLMAAYTAGLRNVDPLDVQDEIPVSGETYPAITVADEQQTSLTAVSTDVNNTAVQIAFLADDEIALRNVLAPVVNEGGCVLVLCNTVTRAQEAFCVAKDLVGEDARLIHARFLANERVRIEAELSAELGKNAHPDAGRPARRVVVATQVVEQSLDLDFDLIVTDIAPIDLVLQRMGRLHRHKRSQLERPEWVRRPRAYIRGIVAGSAETDAPEFSQGIESIYPRALLVLTLAELMEQDGSLELPDAIPHLVQRVYSEGVSIPSGWREDYGTSRMKLQRDIVRARQKARTFQLPDLSRRRAFADLWTEQKADIANNSLAEAAGAAQVRDSDPTLEVIVCRQAEGGYRPMEWVGDGYEDTVLSIGQVPSRDVARDLATSTVRLPYRFSFPTVFDAALDQLEAGTDPAWRDSHYLRGQLQLMLDEEGSAVLVGRRVHYDRELGLIDDQGDCIGEEAV